jgi:hypothetical protein
LIALLEGFEVLRIRMAGLNDRHWLTSLFYLAPGVEWGFFEAPIK